MNNVYLSLEWAKMDRGSMTEEEAAASMCSRLPERLHEQAHLLVDRWDRPILPVPGMAELVRELKEAGYGVYLLSNASYRQHEYWPRVPGSEYFDGTLISADVKLVKPCAEIYELLYSTFGLIPGECLFIDDSAPNIESAERTGYAGHSFSRRRGRASRRNESLRSQGLSLGKNKPEHLLVFRFVFVLAAAAPRGTMCAVAAASAAVSALHRAPPDSKRPRGAYGNQRQQHIIRPAHHTNPPAAA